MQQREHEGWGIQARRVGARKALPPAAPSWASLALMSMAGAARFRRGVPEARRPASRRPRERPVQRPGGAPSRAPWAAPSCSVNLQVSGDGWRPSRFAATLGLFHAAGRRRSRNSRLGTAEPHSRASSQLACLGRLQKPSKREHARFRLRSPCRLDLALLTRCW